MPNSNNEAESRAKIDAALIRAGWRLPGSDSSDVRMEQHTGGGRADYTLNDSSGYPLGVIEAKRSDIDPLSAKEQARTYAESLRARFVILSNGNFHYLWDLYAGDPSPIMEMPTQESLERRKGLEYRPSKFGTEDIGTDYIVKTQGENTPPERKRNLRGYQLRAVLAVRQAAAAGKNRFLLEMATGTGKTLVAAAVIKLFLRSGNAKRVLFLVDRLELEDQAQKSFADYLGRDYQSVIYKANKSDWNRAEIVVSTVQSLTFNERWRNFSPLDFDLLIVDEAHRSIGGRNSRAVFEYFIGYKLGLTATPRDLMRGIDAEQLAEDNPKALDARQFRDTYTTFGCDTSGPTFSYGLLEGVREGYLVNPHIVDARTEITTQLLEDKGATFVIRTDEDEEREVDFKRRDYEHRFFSPVTNRTICRAFMEHALRDPISGEIGKSIAYCVSQDHAAKITQILNNLAAEMFPDIYQSDFAIQVTSRVEDAQTFARDFANNNLRGQTRFLEGYASSRARVCVTVGMMTTGYDCTDILNLCFMRPVFSPSEFVQMKGRGTRRHTFRYRDAEGVDNRGSKEKFVLFDFFAVCEYFEKDHDYDEQLKLPYPSEEERADTAEMSDGEGIYEDIDIPPEQSRYALTHRGKDSISTIEKTAVGPSGMRPDRELFAHFAERVRADEQIKESVANERWGEAVRLVRERYEDKPDDYVTPYKIALSEGLRRLLETGEVLRRIFGLIDRFKDRDELLIEEAQKFIAAVSPHSDEVNRVADIFIAYVNNEDIRKIISAGEFARLADNPTLPAEEWLGLQEETRDAIINYAHDYVRLDYYKGAA